MQFTFKDDPEEANKPINEKTIESRGRVDTFTLIDIFHNQETLKKQLKEALANRDNQQVVMSNLEQHHPFLKDMSEFDKYTVHMYQEAFSKRKAWNTHIETIESTLKTEQDDLAEIQKQLPETASIPSPYAETVPAPIVEAEAVKDEAPKDDAVDNSTNDVAK